jgi:hypothetical protein
MKADTIYLLIKVTINTTHVHIHDAIQEYPDAHIGRIERHLREIQRQERFVKVSGGLVFWRVIHHAAQIQFSRKNTVYS